MTENLLIRDTQKQTIFVIVVSVIVVLLSACTSETDKKLKQGESIVKTNCFVCHGQGINGAPIIGNPKMWGKRAKQGRETLIAHAIEGYNMMPARGGNTELSDEQIQLAVDYMLNQLQ